MKTKNVSRSCFSSVQYSSVAQSCPTLCNPMNRSMPALPVHHQLPEFTQTHGQRSLFSESEVVSMFCHSVSSVQFSRSVVCDSLQPHESQHARPPMEGREGFHHLVTPTGFPAAFTKACLHQLEMRTKPSLPSFPWKPVFPDAPFLLKIS